MEEINFFLKRIWGFVSQTSAAVRSNMRAASCFDLLWSRRHPWLARLSQDGTLWWCVVTGAAAAAAQQDVLDAQAGGAYPLLAYVFCKKRRPGWPYQEPLRSLASDLVKERL